MNGNFGVQANRLLLRRRIVVLPTIEMLWVLSQLQVHQYKLRTDRARLDIMRPVSAGEHDHLSEIK